MKAKYVKPTVEILDFCTEKIATVDDPEFDLELDSMGEWT